MHFRTRAIHVGQEHDPATGAVVPPLHLASTFVQPGAGEWGAYDYSRSGNPTRKALETTLASLEGGTHALAFATGMAATHCATMLLESGQRIVAGTDIYGGTYRLLHRILDRSRIDVSLVDSTDLAAVEAALAGGAKLLWIESPGNPLLSVTDIAACADLAHKHGALLAVDNTLATPVLTRPLEWGADIVMHSATKYLGGHSDLLGGALVVRDKTLFDRLYFIQNATGAVMGPLEAFLCSRALKTLELRVREQCRTAQGLAEFLAADSRVARVLYPGLPSHPGHELAARQMDGAFGAMLSFELAGGGAASSALGKETAHRTADTAVAPGTDTAVAPGTDTAVAPGGTDTAVAPGYAAAKKLVESTRLFQLAVSLGAVESLIEQPASMSHASYAPEARRAHGIGDGLIRLSVGLEAYEDLREDLEQALRGADL